MALFTGKGDGGTTKLFDSPSGVRISKASAVPEALGSLDELNSFLGLCKVKSRESGWYVGTMYPSFEHIVHEIQETLFVIQAELAGAGKTVAEQKVKWLEDITNACEVDMPVITTFSIPGGIELSALFDTARTIARRAERRVVEVVEKKEREVGEFSRAFLNRLSSTLFALARLSNHKSGIKEGAPSYK
jgi:cob(I)alamin adenosyltransferase